MEKEWVLSKSEFTSQLSAITSVAARNNIFFSLCQTRLLYYKRYLCLLPSAEEVSQILKG
jgi:hypothetical protein